MDCADSGHLSRRSDRGICGRSTPGTRSRCGDVRARRRRGGELSHGTESAPAGATCLRHGRTILDAVRAEEPARRGVVLRGRDFRPQYERAVGHAHNFPAPAWPAHHRVVVASKVGRDMKRAVLVLLTCATALQAHAATYYVVVAGLGGEPDYEQRFTAAAKDLHRIFTAAGPTAHVYMLTGEQATGARLAETIGEVARSAKADDDFALILIGHGSFDGVEYKFNLVGPDVTAAEIAAMCDHVAARRQLVVDATSASGGAVQILERPGRAVIAATKSGTEKNATVFARYWVEALEDPAADTDKSDSISAMEAFRYATKKTAAFYASQKRLATEHAGFNDTGRGEAVREAGNGQGLLMSSFTLLRLGTSQHANNDPAKRALLEKKDQLEQKIDTLKYQKAAMDPQDYKTQLTDALVELAKVQEQLDK